MLEKDYFKVQDEFIDDLPNLNGSAIKLYLFFRRSVNEKRNDGNRTWWTYDGIHEKTGLATGSISSGIEQLISNGWIEDIEYRFDSSNVYYLPDHKLATPKIEVLNKFLERKEAMKKKGGTSKIEGQYSKNCSTVLQKLETNVNEINVNEGNVNEINKEENNFDNISLKENTLTNTDNHPVTDFANAQSSQDESINYPISLTGIEDSYENNLDTTPIKNSDTLGESVSDTGPIVDKSSKQSDFLKPDSSIQLAFLTKYGLTKWPDDRSKMIFLALEAHPRKDKLFEEALGNATIRTAINYLEIVM